MASDLSPPFSGHGPEGRAASARDVGQEPMHRGPGPLRNGNPRGNPALAPRCGARTRAGCPCNAPALRGRTRCRMHGGASTGPRTAAGLARLRAARTVHGRYSAEMRAEFHHTRVMLRRARLLEQAVRLRRWLSPAMTARLMQGPRELGVPERDRSPCTVSRRMEQAAMQAEAAALAPWREAIAAAKVARKQGCAIGQDPTHRENAAVRPSQSKGVGVGSGPAPGQGQLPEPEARHDAAGKAGGAQAARQEPMHPEKTRSWTRGWKGDLCGGTSLSVPASLHGSGETWWIMVETEDELKPVLRQ